MYEHGLGVPRDYEAAWAHYDRARKIMPVEGDVDQRMNGVPIEVLVFLAKTRYVTRLCVHRDGAHN